MLHPVHLKIRINPRRLVVAAVMALVVAAGSPTFAQGQCAQLVDTLLDTSTSCVNEPWRDRAKDSQIFEWKGHDYLIFNRGNELEIYDIDDPVDPMHIETSDYRFGNRGDSDYDLLWFNVCDDCRYGVLAHKIKGTVLFDLGGPSNSIPGFTRTGRTEHTPSSEYLAGGFVFSKGAQQYLIAAGLIGGCEGFASTLYAVHADDDLELLQCLSATEGTLLVRGLNTVTVSGGELAGLGLEEDDGVPGHHYLYLGSSQRNVEIFRAVGEGSELQLVYEKPLPDMYGQRGQLAIDQHPGFRRAASAQFNEGYVAIWDLTDPLAPQLVRTVDVDMSMVAMRSPSAGAPATLITHLFAQTRSTRTFSVDDGGVSEVAPGFWESDAVKHSVCLKDYDAEVSPDGTVVYQSRFSLHEVYDLGECLAPTPPGAAIQISPDPVWPGDTVFVRDDSTGLADRWALWVTEGSDPAGTALEGDSSPSGDNDRLIYFEVPADVLENTEYWAHVTVESDDFDPPEDVDSASDQIMVDRAPGVTVSVNPEAVIVGESVTLSAEIEGGHPAPDPGNGSAYEWRIWAPGAGAEEYDQIFGQIVPNYSLDTAGVWGFQVWVHYPHGASGGGDLDGDGLYEASNDPLLTLSVTSVAAAFTMSPNNPVHTDTIVLDASPSKPAGGNLSYTWLIQQLGGGDEYTDCPQGVSAVTCTIPSEALLADTTYVFSLEVENLDDGEKDYADETRTIADGNVDPVIRAVPASPERGEQVMFYIDGVNQEIDSAIWDMGGPGCDQDAEVTCQQTIFGSINCNQMPFRYSTYGTKNVQVTFKIGEAEYSAQTSLIVQSSGQCEATGDDCVFQLNPTSTTVGPAENTRSFTVSTKSSCEWTPSTSAYWIDILEPDHQVSGNRTVRYRVDQNTYRERYAFIRVGNQSSATNFRVTQSAPWVPKTFTVSNRFPEIGEWVTFSADPILEVTGWHFGEQNCRGTPPTDYCQFGDCHTKQWSFREPGEKTITMYLASGEAIEKELTVRKIGECCDETSGPDAGFSASATTVLVGETVQFTDTSGSKSLKVLTTALTPSSTNPEKGQVVTFTIDNPTGTITQAVWNFDGPGCDDLEPDKTCNSGLYDNCTAAAYRYSTEGARHVTVTAYYQGGGQAELSADVVVANSGSCGSGEPTTCSYSLSDSNESFGPDGGGSAFSVTTGGDCDWTPRPTRGWVHIVSGAGPGPGSVVYSVEPYNNSGSRIAYIEVEDKEVRITQTGIEAGVGADRWEWIVERREDELGEVVDDEPVTFSTQNLTHTFEKAGLYRVIFRAGNCFAWDWDDVYITVNPAPVENFVVASAISSRGANDTQWESDFRFFNACDENLDVSLVYQPDNQDNSAKQLSSYPFILGPNETKVFPNARDVVNADDGEKIDGSILIDSASQSGCKVLSVSRTFNDTPDGTLGLFVPAMPVKSVGVKALNLTGLISNDEYRSNLRLVNHGDAEAWVRITLFDKNGNALNGDGKSVKVLAHSTKQINEVAPWAGVDVKLSQFTVLAEVRTEGAIIDGFGTVTDNISGDSVMNSSSYLDETIVWLPGVVFAPGMNDTFWQTDIWFHNPEADNQWLTSNATYVDGGSLDLSYLFESPEWPSLEAMGMRRRLDIAGSIVENLNEEKTSGYLVFEGLNGDSAPQIAARTFTSDESGGTFGLHLPSFGPRDLLGAGDISYLVGVSNSADELSGYRTNLAFLATGRTVEVEVTFFHLDGTPTPTPWTTTVWPGQLKQVNNVFRKFGLGGETVTGTFKIEVLSGNDLIVYATETDNKTGDSIFIPAQLPIYGAVP
jgi:hypothetical protein